MDNEQSQTGKPNLNLIMVGAVGQGKTTLSAALTRYSAKAFGTSEAKYEDLCSNKQEKVGEVLCAVARVKYHSQYAQYTQLDFADPAACMKCLASGAIKADGAILVCSVSDKLTQIVTDQVKACRNAGISRFVVFLNKADVADPELVELLEVQLRDLLSNQDLPGDDIPFITGSALLADEDRQQGDAASLLASIDTHVRLG